MTQTAMQEHIEWLKATIEIAEEQYPILVNTLKLCLNDATQRLEMEKDQMLDIYINHNQYNDNFLGFDDYYNETFK